MEASGENGLIRLDFEPAECRALLRVLESIRQAYQTDPTNFPAPEAAVWYSTRGCQSAGLNPEETQEWVRHLFEFRSASLELLESWIARLRQTKKHEPCTLELTPDHAPSFVRILNDHRLLVAARHDIGEHEMKQSLFRSLKDLSAQRQSARFEIEWLAHMIEAILAALPHSGADWDRSLLRPESD